MNAPAAPPATRRPRLDVPDALARLDLAARRAVEGLAAGRHRGPRAGVSVEFAEHRPYAPGDDPRRVDWRAYGRLDRFFIRQRAEETHLRATILLDASGSMAYTGAAASTADGRPLSKFDYALRLAAALTHLLARQRDAVGLTAFDTHTRVAIPPRSRPGQAEDLLTALAGLAPGGETAQGPILREMAERLPRRGLVVLIGDLLDDEAAILDGLARMHRRGHDLLIFHVLADEELEFPFAGLLRVRDLEQAGAPPLTFDPKSVRARYLARMNRSLDRLEQGCARLGAQYARVRTSEPYDQALIRALAARRRGR